MKKKPSSDEIVTTKETITFITPEQPHAEHIMWNQWTVKLVAYRMSDGLVSSSKFVFDICPHDFYTHCIFCDINPDKQKPGPNTLPPPKEIAKPCYTRSDHSCSCPHRIHPSPPQAVCTQECPISWGRQCSVSWPHSYLQSEDIKM